MFPSSTPTGRRAESLDQQPGPAKRVLGTPGNGIPVAEIVSALSFALDLTEDAVPGHALRSCLFGMRLAQAIGLGEADRSNLFYALLLKDVGCSSNAARLCQVMASDERSYKRDIKFEDWSRTTLSGLGTIWRHLAPRDNTFARVRRLIQLGQEQNLSREVFTLRCDRGASIVLHIGLPENCSVAVRHLDEHWDGSGFPESLQAEAIPLLSRILLVSQHLDVFSTGRGPQAALDSLADRSGRWFDPSLVRAAESLHNAGLLFSDTSNEAKTRAAVLDLEPGQRLRASDDQIDDICEAFAEVVDVKSSFTGSHSRKVTTAALGIAEALGFHPDRKRFIGRASLLHDLGKLRVPNTILDKPGRLTDDEFAIVREHPALTAQILSRVADFSAVATIAGQHHEKLDGSGYPYGLTADQLSLESRLIAVADTYSALNEDRPYRPGLTLPEIRKIMDRQAGLSLDGHCYEALLATLPA